MKINMKNITDQNRIGGNRSIGNKRENNLTGVSHWNFAGLIGIEPHLPLPALQDAASQTLLELQSTHSFSFLLCSHRRPTGKWGLGLGTLASLYWRILGFHDVMGWAFIITYGAWAWVIIEMKMIRWILILRLWILTRFPYPNIMCLFRA